MSVNKLDFDSIIQSKKGFTTSLNDVIQNIRDPLILGIYVYLTSLPPQWCVNRNHLMDHFNIGREKLHKALRWLHVNYLISYEQQRNANGTVDKSTMVVHEGWEFLEKVVNNQQSSSALLKTRIAAPTALLKNRTPVEPYSGETAPINTIENIKEIKRERVTRQKRAPLSESFVFNNEVKQLAEEVGRRVGLTGSQLREKFVLICLESGKTSADWNASAKKFLLTERIVIKENKIPTANNYPTGTAYKFFDDPTHPSNNLLSKH